MFDWHVKRKLRHTWQIWTRGYTSCDTWNLDWNIASNIAPRLKEFKQLNNGYPHGLTYDSWNDILDQMIYSFEVLANEDWRFDLTKDDVPRVQEGLDLFAKYFWHLWW